MPTLYWYGGSGNWNDGTTHWSTNSGNIPSATHTTPSATDDVVFDALSNATAYTVTMDAGTNVCQNFTMGGPTLGAVTWAGSVALAISGSLNMSGGTAGITRNYTGRITFNATAGTKTITSNGVKLPSITFNGVGGTFQLADNLLVTSDITRTNGTFDATTNLTTVTLDYASSVAMSITGIFTGSNAFYNLANNNLSASDSLTLSGDITVTNNLTFTGKAANQHILVKSNTVGTPRTITCTGASVNYSNTDFQDITIVDGTLGTNSSVGDCGGNTGITFTGTADQHWVGTIANSGTGTWSTAANWTSRVPLPQDNVYMNFAFGTSCTVSADMPRLGKSIDWTGATWTTALTWGNSLSNTLYGSLTLISGLTVGANNGLLFAGRNDATFTTFGLTIDRNISIGLFGKTLTLVGNLIAHTFSLTTGTFDFTPTTSYVLSAINLFMKLFKSFLEIVFI